MIPRLDPIEKAGLHLRVFHHLLPIISVPAAIQRRKPNDASGPIVMVLILAAIVFFVVNEPQMKGDALSIAPTFSGSAFLSGIERRISPEFRGADVSAFMGGVDLDLRDATMEGEEARIDVSAMMGGIDIRVPPSWTVINRVTAIMGGVCDRTRHTGNSRQTLVVEGTVFMGGVDIKN
jgi:hypothetical protein